ncbi:MAG: amino acid adenylation domain-containing protein, partial [Algicola sp.]|nr:amino acid adenylation domain-containing protein [Algicola sp.]
LSGFYGTLAGLSGQNDIVIGSPTDNRHHAQTQSLVGFFVNALVLRAQLSANDDITDLISQVHDLVLQAKVHQDLPFEQLVDALNIKRMADRHPLFQVMFTVQDFVQKALETNDLPFEAIDGETQKALYSPAKFDLTVFMSVAGPQIQGNFNYAVSLFDRTAIVALTQMFERVLSAFVDIQSTKISQIELLSDEQKAVLHQWSGADKPYQYKTTVQQLFEAQVVKTPGAIALVDDEHTLTYEQLNHQANQLAAVICSQHKVEPNSLIALYMQRSTAMIVSILAVLKAGGGYVPISPAYPLTRVKFMLDDSQAMVIIGEPEDLETLEVEAVLISAHARLATQTDNLKPVSSAADLAYVMYTSGTSGKPKGVLTPHRAVVSLIVNTDFISIKPTDAIAHMSDAGFDASTFEIWAALLNGAKLVVAPVQVDLDAESVGQFIERHQISVMWLTRALFDELYNQQPNLFAQLRYLLTGGEALTPAIIEQLVAQPNRPQHILNGYGPTEGTTFTTIFACHEFEGAYNGSVPLGKPINSAKVYVLDEAGRLAPVGTPGELYIGGAGLALGYLNRPDLTASHFVDNPFVEGKGEKLYKTGDKVRWTTQGNLEYLGRNDFQVKIRGFRVETGEVEQLLQRFDGVNQACVMARSFDQQDQLVAYCQVDTLPVNDDDSEFVDEWETLYEDLYKQPDEYINTFDTAGWNSSFTDEPIPEPEMREWAEATTNRILGFAFDKNKATNILEIGCGTGLLLYPLVEHCQSYLGVDFSTGVVNRLNASFAPLGITNARVVQGLADQISELKTADIDTVIINSVVQYFPNIDYLDDVISQAVTTIAAAKKQGRIFIGDVRDYQLLHDFHVAVQRFKHPDSDSKTIEQTALFDAQNEGELLVDRDYFTGLSERYGQISRVEVLSKIGDAQHEMNLYRYDVILHINTTDAVTNTGVINKALANTPVRLANKRYDFEPLKSYLKAQLPAYMIPAFFIEVEHFSLTRNGKIDRSALPHPNIRTSDDFVAPSTELERQLCQIWQDVLGVERVGVEDNYFSLGGNSISAIRLCAACRKELKRELSLALLFEHKTVAALALHITDELITIDKSDCEFYPLSFAQERLFFIEQFEGQKSEITL